MRKDGLKDLDLYSTDELIDEVLNRSQMGIFYGLYPCDGQPDKRDEFWNYRGNPLSCSGMALVLAHKIARDYEQLANGEIDDSMP